MNMAPPSLPSSSNNGMTYQHHHYDNDAQFSTQTDSQQMHFSQPMTSHSGGGGHDARLSPEVSRPSSAIV